jgi:hypothetical protein
MLPAVHHHTRQTGICAIATLAGAATLAAGCGSSANPPASQLIGLHVLSSITDGAVLSDPVTWTAQPVGMAPGDPVDRVEFSIDGQVRWTEHNTPYFFNDDYNRLYPWVLGAGQHRLAVRVITAAGKSASTSAEVTVSAQPQPAGLVGTYTRMVTPSDITRTQSFRDEPADQVLPAGTWRLRVAPDGVFHFDDPQGQGGSEAFTAVADGTLTMQGPVNWLELPARRDIFCGLEPTGAYRWTITAHTLVLRARRDRCADRNSMFTGTWRRT